ncbi:MAG: OmpA family protein [SAR324 cluster bacterium]|nr:OmpA family protein [SAR324 cluster bacterium]
MPVFEEEHKCEEFDQWWIFTYGDLMTLLLVFFILLFSFCKTDVEKFKSVAESFKPVPAGSPFFLEGRESVLEQLVRQIETSEISEEVFITIDPRGVVVSFRDTALFESGSAALTARAHKTLNRFVAYLFGLPNDILVEGHTDDRPIATAQFPSNWDLSSGRASTVARFFETEGVKGGRIRVLGYGQYRPRFRNDTPEKRALNRRIDVVIKPQ